MEKKSWVERQLDDPKICRAFIEEQDKLIESYWQALYAVRCIAEHSGGKKDSAEKMRGEIENIRKIADDTLGDEV